MAEELQNRDKNGLNRCPKCGATDVKLVPKTGMLQCLFCRTEFKGKAVNAQGGVPSVKVLPILFRAKMRS